MDISSGPHRESFGTYIVPARLHEEEQARLLIQDQLITDGMGAVLPEQPDPTRFRSILDVGCGPGGWLIQTAQTYPTIPRLMGIDLCQNMIASAKEQAEQQQVSDRVEFQVMDALRVLDFPSDTWDLVNQRMGSGYVRVWDWPRLLQEFRRVARPGGVIRVTDNDMVGSSSSEAVNRLSDLYVRTFYQAGYLFTPDHNGLLNELPRLFKQHGISNVQTRTHLLEFCSNTRAGKEFVEDMVRAMRTTLPFLQKWSRIPDDFEELCRRAVSDMQQPDFVATWKILTVWGNKDML